MLLRTAVGRAHRARRGLAGVPPLAPADGPCRWHSADGARGASHSRRRSGCGGGNLRGGRGRGGFPPHGPPCWTASARGRGGRGRSIASPWSYAGADPRIALRQQDELSDTEIEQIVGRLRRLDARSPAGPWTTRVLTAVEEQPGVVARTLAERLGCEKDWLKPQVRKLKNLGLTVSLTTGYELSPRGRVVAE